MLECSTCATHVASGLWFALAKPCTAVAICLGPSLLQWERCVRVCVLVVSVCVYCCFGG